jgi:hypothetical protein
VRSTPRRTSARLRRVSAPPFTNRLRTTWTMAAIYTTFFLANLLDMYACTLCLVGQIHQRVWFTQNAPDRKTTMSEIACSILQSKMHNHFDRVSKGDADGHSSSLRDVPWDLLTRSFSIGSERKTRVVTALRRTHLDSSSTKLDILLLHQQACKAGASHQPPLSKRS